jgi:hypothetical protein
MISSIKFNVKQLNQSRPNLIVDKNVPDNMDNDMRETKGSMFKFSLPLM